MPDDLNEVYMKLNADRQACSSPQSGTQKSDKKVTRRSPSAATNAEDAAFEIHKKLIVDTYKAAEPTKDKCSHEPPSYGLTVQKPGDTEASPSMEKRDSIGMKEEDFIRMADLNNISHVRTLHGRPTVSSDGPSAFYNSSELAVVAKEDATRSKIAGPIVGSILGASVLILMAMFFAWRKKRMQKIAENDEEKLERGQIESGEDKAEENAAVASIGSASI